VKFRKYNFSEFYENFRLGFRRVFVCVVGLDEETRTDREDKDEDKTESESEEEEEETKFVEDTVPPVETLYVENSLEELGQQGDASQTEEVADENKSLIWSLVKQVCGLLLNKYVMMWSLVELVCSLSLNKYVVSC